MQTEPKQPRRIRVERGIYRSPTTGKYEIQYTDSTGRVRWQTVGGGVRDARYALAEVQTRLGRGDLIVRGDRTFADVGDEWLAAQHHLRPRTRRLYETALELHINPRLARRGSVTSASTASPRSFWSSSRPGSPARPSVAS